jgi:hypothetical protein
VDGAVRNGQRFAGLENLVGLAVRREPELALHDLRHDDAGCEWAAGLEARRDFHGRVDHLEIGAGNVGLLQDGAFYRRWLQWRLLRFAARSNRAERGNAIVAIVFNIASSWRKEL